MGKEFARLNPVELSSLLIDGMLEREPSIAPHIQRVIWGMVVPDPNLYSIAREAVLASRLDPRVEAYSVSRACATSLQAAANAAHHYNAFPQEPSISLAGGVESFSSAKPVVTERASRLFKTLAAPKAGLWTKLAALLTTPPLALWPVPPSAKEYSTGLTMGEHCELMVKEFKIARERQDRFALASHLNAVKARGDLAGQIIPVAGVKRDTLIREDTSPAALAALRPAFDRSAAGTITAGNASPYTDGAAALYVVSPALEGKVSPEAHLVDTEFVGVAPKKGLLMGPGKAMLRLLERHGLRWDDVDYLEMHEAFAGQILSNVEAVNDPAYRQGVYGISFDPGRLEEARLNPWGSSIAYGHPFGATGARMLNQAIAYLHKTNTKRALLGICTAGGLAGAALLERR